MGAAPGVGGARVPGAAASPRTPPAARGAGRVPALSRLRGCVPEEPAAPAQPRPPTLSPDLAERPQGTAPVRTRLQAKAVGGRAAGSSPGAILRTPYPWPPSCGPRGPGHAFCCRARGTGREERVSPSCPGRRLSPSVVDEPAASWPRDGLCEVSVQRKETTKSWKTAPKPHLVEDELFLLFPPFLENKHTDRRHHEEPAEGGKQPKGDPSDGGTGERAGGPAGCPPPGGARWPAAGAPPSEPPRAAPQGPVSSPSEPQRFLTVSALPPPPSTPRHPGVSCGGRAGAGTGHTLDRPGSTLLCSTEKR